MIEANLINETEILNKKFCIYGTYENPLFLAKDVAEWIEHKNARVMLKTVDEEEKIKVLHPVNNVYGVSKQLENQWFLTEHGLYEVLFHSRKPIAKKFKHEVKKILKEIRLNKTTYYEKSLPKDYKEALEELLFSIEEIELLKEKIELDKTKLAFIEAITTSEKTISINTLAKILKNGDTEIGSSRLYEKLREGGFLIKQPGSDYNKPTQKAIDMGVLKVNSKPYKDADGSVFISSKAVVTGKGIKYFVGLFLEEDLAYE